MLMDAAVKELWVAALGGGGYVQGTGTLKNAWGNFCCLGVLCDLYRQHVGGGWETDETGLTLFADKAGNTCFETCTAGVVRWAGLAGGDPEVSQKRLSEWNDNQRISFNSIANLINENL